MYKVNRNLSITFAWNKLDLNSYKLIISWNQRSQQNYGKVETLCVNGILQKKIMNVWWLTGLLFACSLLT